MKKLTLLLVLAGQIFTMSCNDDEDSDPNRPPDSFTVTVIDIAANEATLEWNGVGDPDEDFVTFEVTFEGELVANDIGNGGTIRLGLNGLEASTAYSGFVTADDGVGGTTEAPFSFTTLSEGGRK